MGNFFNGWRRKAGCVALVMACWLMTQTLLLREYNADLWEAFERSKESIDHEYTQIERTPDLIICDGQGVAHPRRCGFASHLGILFDLPTIGCGKTRLTGTYAEPGTSRGDWSELTSDNEAIGSVLRTQSGIKPLYVSTGHRVSLPTARDWILRLAPEYRQPEPIRRANQLANELRHSHRTV